MDYFLPLFLIVCSFIALLWWFSALEYVGGAAGVGSFLAVFFGVRIDWLRRQREKLRKEHEETVEFIQNEITKVYKGRMDPSGRIFANYCKLFEVRATAQDMDVGAFNEKLLKLQVGRRAAGLRLPDLLKKLNIDMTYNSNAIEGNPISYKETKIILAGFVGPRRRSVRHVHDIIGHSTAFEEIQRLVHSACFKEKCLCTINILTDQCQLVLINLENTEQQLQFIHDFTTTLNNFTTPASEMYPNDCGFHS